MPPLQGRMGRPMRDHRVLVEGAIWRFRTGSSWRDLPSEFGPWQTVWKRHARFAEDSVWDEVLTVLLAEADAAGQLDWQVSALLAGAFSAAKAEGNRDVLAHRYRHHARGESSDADEKERRTVVAAAIPTTGPALETTPSLAPSTPVRNQFDRAVSLVNVDGCSSYRAGSPSEAGPRALGAAGAPWDAGGVYRKHRRPRWATRPPQYLAVSSWGWTALVLRWQPCAGQPESLEPWAWRSMLSRPGSTP